MRRALLLTAISLLVTGSAFAQERGGSTPPGARDPNGQNREALDEILTRNNFEKKRERDRLALLNRDRKRSLDESNRRNEQVAASARRRAKQKKRRQRIILWTTLGLMFVIIFGSQAHRRKAARRRNSAVPEDPEIPEVDHGN